MSTSQNLVTVVEDGTSYDKYLELLEKSFKDKSMVAHGNIVFPIPCSYDEYSFMKEIKTKILYFFYEQNSMFGINIEQIVFWSLEINEGTKSLPSWEHLDPSDYSLILTKEDFVEKPWSITYYNEGNNAKYKNVSPDIILYFEKDNERHMQNVNEILKFEAQNLSDEKGINSNLIQILIPAERILNIKW